MKNIVEKAKELKICKESLQEYLKEPTIEKLCDLYFKGDDWAMENDFPTLPLLRENKGKSEDFGLYTDFKGSLSDIYKLALFGNSDVDLEYGGFTVAKLNIRHNSKAKIEAKGYAILTINILDSAEVEIEVKDNARVYVCDYGKGTNIISNGNVKVENREL